jgi:hypothetical protein
MTGSMSIYLHAPSLSFNFDFEVFPAKPPRFVAGIYPLLGFDPLIEFCTKISYLNANTAYAYAMFS